MSARWELRVVIMRKRILIIIMMAGGKRKKQQCCSLCFGAARLSKFALFCLLCDWLHWWYWVLYLMRGEKASKSIVFYKITKIVCVLWLAERCVCIRVCKHSCDVKMFCLSCTNILQALFEKSFEFKTWQVYFAYLISSLAETWEICRNILYQFFSL